MPTKERKLTSQFPSLLPNCSFFSPNFRFFDEKKRRRAGHRSHVTGSIRGWSQSHLTYKPGGCCFEERKLTLQSPSISVEFLAQYNLKLASQFI